MSDLTTLITTLNRLKQVKRQGWLDRGVPHAEVESVADHTFMTAIVAWFAAAEVSGLDRDRVLKLALVHDMAEAIVGDMPPYAPTDLPNAADTDARRAFFSRRHRRSPQRAAAKDVAEERAFEQLAGQVPAPLRDEFTALWTEYEHGMTPEAQFVKECDTLEAFLQAHHYHRQDPGLPLSGFFDMAAHEITHPTLTGIRDAVLTSNNNDRDRTDAP